MYQVCMRIHNEDYITETITGWIMVQNRTLTQRFYTNFVAKNPAATRGFPTSLVLLATRTK